MSVYRGIVTAALLLTAGFAVSSGCGQGADKAPTPEPHRDEGILRDLTFAQVVRAAFEVPSLQGEGQVVKGPDGSLYRSLGRLIGHLSYPQALEMAIFLEYLPSQGPTAPDGLALGPGVYMVVVDLDRNRQPLYGPLSLLAASGREILTVERARAQGIVPLQPETQELDTVVSVSPAIIIDLEGDGVEELVLARRSRRGQVSRYEHDVYQRRPGTPEWAIADRSEVMAPGLAALAYWSDVMSAVRLATRWDPETRLRVVWSWLSDEGAPLTPELLLELVPDGDDQKVRAEQEALAYLRTFFQEAHAQLSEGFRVRQPWPAFVNGFKDTVAVELLGVSPPTAAPDGEATVDVLLDLTEREGDTPTTRRFLVTTSLVEEGEAWFLEDVEAAEQRKPE